MSKIKPVLYILGLTLGIFILTKNPLTSPLKLQFSLLSLLGLIGYAILLHRKNSSLFQSHKFIYFFTATSLLLVGATGWFFSPFFFFLYLLAIILSFLFSMTTSVTFVVVMVVLFSFNIGEVDLTYDFLVVLSLLTTIPLSFYLRREYLNLKESAKDILVLKNDETREFESKVEEVLSNKIHNFAANLRQPINDVKQITYLIKKAKTSKNQTERLDKIVEVSEEALRSLQKFEEESTGAKLLSSPTNS